MARPGGVGGAAQLGCDRRHLGQRARAEEDERDVQVLGGDDPAAVQVLVLQLLDCQAAIASTVSPGSCNAQKRRTRSSPPTLAAAV